MGIYSSYHTQQGDFDYEDDEPGSYITQDGKCSNCGEQLDFDDLSAFEAEESGVEPGTIYGPAVHWATGTIACPNCKERLPYETSS